jgi:hypothetical protein
MVTPTHKVDEFVHVTHSMLIEMDMYMTRTRPSLEFLAEANVMLQRAGVIACALFAERPLDLRIDELGAMVAQFQVDVCELAARIAELQRGDEPLH